MIQYNTDYIFLNENFTDFYLHFLYFFGNDAIAVLFIFIKLLKH